MSALTPPVPLTLRRATTADLGTVAALSSACWQAAYRGILPQSFLDERTADAVAQRMAAHLAGGWAEFTIAEAAGKPAGFTVVEPCRDADARGLGEVSAIYLLPEYWRHGYGRTMLNAGLASLHARGMWPAAVWVLAQNTAARAFYEANAFAPDGASKTLDLGGPFTALRCRRSEPPTETRDTPNETRSTHE